MYSSRDPTKLNTPYARTDVYKYSYFTRTIRSWNELPTNITEAATVDVFKKELALAINTGIITLVAKPVASVPAIQALH